MDKSKTVEGSSVQRKEVKGAESGSSVKEGGKL